MEIKSKILLESGTNEVEIVEFRVGKEWYGINVAKVREIIRADIHIVKTPNSHHAIEGVINLRNVVIPVINIMGFFNIEDNSTVKEKRIIIAEFNNIRVGFLVSFVSKIHRISWEAVEKPSDLIHGGQGQNYAVAVIRIEDRILLLLDFEKITAEISPQTNVQQLESTSTYKDFKEYDRSKRTILIAEDSGFVINIIVEHLEQVGYKYVTANNGLEAWEYLETIVNTYPKDDILDHFALLITDIEMPKMDGFHLVKKIKSTPELKSLPCVIFSSLITPDLILKCEDVGADGQISKPELPTLVKMVDDIITRTEYRHQR